MDGELWGWEWSRVEQRDKESGQEGVEAVKLVDCWNVVSSALQKLV